MYRGHTRQSLRARISELETENGELRLIIRHLNATLQKLILFYVTSEESDKKHI